MANTKIQSEQIVDDVALGGNPTTTTQSAGNNTTRVATTAFVTTAVSNLVDSAPSNLDTLNELAAAMNDNASFFSTVLPLSGGTMTGGLVLGGTTPTLTIGDAGAEDTKIVFDGNAQDYYIGLDDSADDLVIGLGSAVGTTPIISIDENSDVAIPNGAIAVGQATFSGSSVLADFHGSGSGVGAQLAFANDHNTDKFYVGLEGNTTGDGFLYQQKDADINFYTNNAFAAKIDSAGRLLVGSTAALSVTGGARQFQIEGTTGVTAAMSIIRHSNSAGGATISLSKSRATADGGVTVVAHNDVLGELRFTGADGSDHDAVAAAIKGEVDGTPGSNDMPARLTFWTTSGGSAAETERFRIDPNGAVRNMGATMAPTSHTTERTFAVSFPNGVANQKFKLILSSTFWGTFDVALTGTYSNQNMAGIIEKRFGTGLNANSVFTNVSRITESLGPISDNFHIGDIEWDSSLSKWVIVITHRVSTGNVLRLRVRTFAEPAGAGGQTSALEFTVGSIYTTDSTAYGQQKRIPCFHANISSSVALSANPIVFNAETFDSGGNYDTSNGRFTAPVSGVYHFAMNLLIYPHTAGVLSPKFLLNGNTYAYFVQQGYANASHTAVSRTSLISMSAGQYVQVICAEGASVNSGCNIYGGQSYFTGHLVAEGNP